MTHEFCCSIIFLEVPVSLKRSERNVRGEPKPGGSMGSKKEVDPMVQGLSMAQDFLGKLVGEIERQGGYAAQLHFLTTSRGEETLREVAKVIANAKWQVPLSLIRRLVGEASKEDWQETYVESDMAWGWQLTVLAKLGIPFIF